MAYFMMMLICVIWIIKLCGKMDFNLFSICLFNILGAGHTHTLRDTLRDTYLMQVHTDRWQKRFPFTGTLPSILVHQQQLIDCFILRK